MSRTIRRNQKWLTNYYVGSREECVKDPHWVMHRYPTLTFEQAYAREKARLHRDHNPGHYGVPRWFRRLHGSKQIRLNEKAALHRCVRHDQYDVHAPDSKARNAAWYWW